MEDYLMIKYAVVSVSKGHTYKIFDSRSEANYYITGVFGPDWRLVKVIECVTV